MFFSFDDWPKFVSRIINQMEGLRVIIVDNNLVFKEDFKSVLESEFSFKVVATFDDDKDLSLQGFLPVDVVFVNLFIARNSGFQMIKQFLQDNPDVKVIGINSFFSEQIYLVHLIENGFKGCIDSNNIYNELSDAIDRVMQGDTFFSNKLLKTSYPNGDTL